MDSRNVILMIFDQLSANMEYKVFGIPMKGIARGALISGLYNTTEDQALEYLKQVHKLSGDALRQPLKKL